MARMDHKGREYHKEINARLLFEYMLSFCDDEPTEAYRYFDMIFRLYSIRIYKNV